MRLLPDGSIEFSAAELPDVLAAQAKMRDAAKSSAPEGAAPAMRIPQIRAFPEATYADGGEEPEEEEEDWPGLLAFVQYKPLVRKALRVVQKAGTLTMPEMIKALGVENEFNVSGAITGVTKAGAKFGFERGALIQSTRRPDGVVVYTCGNRLTRGEDVPEIPE